MAAEEKILWCKLCDSKKWANALCCNTFPNRMLHSFGMIDNTLVHQSPKAAAIGDMCSSYSEHSTRVETPVRTKNEFHAEFLCCSLLRLHRYLKLRSFDINIFPSLSIL